MRFTIIFFGIMVIAQWFIPLETILSQEHLLKEGKTFKFKTRPVDPYDLFRGKYITLNFDAGHYVDTVDQKFERGDLVFVRLGTDSAGFVAITGVSKAKPESGDYVEATIENNFETRESNYSIDLKYSFEKFFMEESKARKAEALLRRSSGKRNHVCYALVKILEGKPAIEDVMVDGFPIGIEVAK